MEKLSASYHRAIYALKEYEEQHVLSLRKNIWVQLYEFKIQIMEDLKLNIQYINNPPKNSGRYFIYYTVTLVNADTDTVRILIWDISRSDQQLYYKILEDL